MIKSAKYILTGLFFCGCQLFAQTTGFIKGLVTDKTNSETLPGALITVDKQKALPQILTAFLY